MTLSNGGGNAHLGIFMPQKRPLASLSFLPSLLGGNSNSLFPQTLHQLLRIKKTLTTALLNQATNGTLWLCPVSSRSNGTDFSLQAWPALWRKQTPHIISGSHCYQAPLPVPREYVTTEFGGQPERMALKKSANTMGARFIMKLFASLSCPDIFPLVVNICLCKLSDVSPRQDQAKW